jgi:hypothetical protein
VAIVVARALGTWTKCSVVSTSYATWKLGASDFAGSEWLGGCDCELRTYVDVKWLAGARVRRGGGWWVVAWWRLRIKFQKSTALLQVKASEPSKRAASNRQCGPPSHRLGLLYVLESSSARIPESPTGPPVHAVGLKNQSPPQLPPPAQASRRPIKTTIEFLKPLGVPGESSAI